MQQSHTRPFAASAAFEDPPSPSEASGRVATTSSAATGPAATASCAAFARFASSAGQAFGVAPGPGTAGIAVALDLAPSVTSGQLALRHLLLGSCPFFKGIGFVSFLNLK